MFQIKQIVCPVDFSEISTSAFQYACSVANHCGSAVLLEHVIEPICSTGPLYSYIPPDLFDQVERDMADSARQHLSQLIAERDDKAITVYPFVRRGLIAGEILSFAEQKFADLIVMGSHGRHGLDKAVLGSVAEKVLRKASCPVLVVHQPTGQFRLRSILCCTDFSGYSERALAYGISLASECGAELVLLHVLDNLPDSADLPARTADVLAQMEQQVPPEIPERLRIRCVVRVGRPFQQIVLTAIEYQADMVVMGVAGRNALDLALFGSTTYRVIQGGELPVLVIPATAASTAVAKGGVNVTNQHLITTAAAS